MNLLPIGTQHFPHIVAGNYLYVDKTELIHQLIHNVRVGFLSRPRRFGKSLLISTLEAIFQGRQELFKDLWIGKSDYQWPEHPVIKIDFSALTNTNAHTLEQAIKERLQEIYDYYHIPMVGTDDLKHMFRQLIRRLSTQLSRQVILLIDEYDKPIIDHITDLETAEANRSVLKQFYSVIKPSDEYLRFVFITGISKFSQVSIFSDLNSLQDISLSIKYASLLGITQEELEHNFTPYLQALASGQELSEAEAWKEVKYWYNGFNFTSANITVYNPFSTLLLFEQQEFRSYWFATATPSFLVKLIQQQNYDITALETTPFHELSLVSFDIDKLKIPVLLLQTGYLTLASYDKQTQFYRLRYPNYEVKQAFLNQLSESYAKVDSDLTLGYLHKLKASLATNKLEDFFETLSIFFANIPYHIQLNNEKYYQSIFYLVFTLLGLHIEVEVMTNKGRIDVVIELADSIYLFEFKLRDSAESALQQIKTKGYYEKYLRQGKALCLVGVGFDQDARNIGEFLVETCCNRFFNLRE